MAAFERRFVVIFMLVRAFRQLDFALPHLLCGMLDRTYEKFQMFVQRCIERIPAVGEMIVRHLRRMRLLLSQGAWQ
jgi:hypothetical protein